MPSIPTDWNDDLLTGVAEIDRQHRVLFNILNDAKGLADDERGKLTQEAITRDLLAYAIYHFETEEKLIKEYGYDQAEPADAEFHIQEHRRFSGRVVAMRNSQEPGNVLLPFLTDWLVNHILTTDRRLGRFIRAKTSLSGTQPVADKLE